MKMKRFVKRMAAAVLVIALVAAFAPLAGSISGGRVGPKRAEASTDFTIREIEWVATTNIAKPKLGAVVTVPSDSEVRINDPRYGTPIDGYIEWRWINDSTDEYWGNYENEGDPGHQIDGTQHFTPGEWQLIAWVNIRPGSQWSFNEDFWTQEIVRADVGGMYFENHGYDMNTPKMWIRFESELITVKGNVASIEKARIAAINSKVYTGKAITPSPKVTLGGKALKRGTDYKVSYKNNRSVGAAKAIITGIGDYAGTRTVSFSIIPKSTKISRVGTKLSKKKKDTIVVWKAQKTKMASSRITGYQIQYSTSPTFAKKQTKKALTVKGYKKTKKVISGLKVNKKYFFRIRTYMASGKKAYYSKWSAKKSYVKK